MVVPGARQLERERLPFDRREPVRRVCSIPPAPEPEVKRGQDVSNHPGLKGVGGAGIRGDRDPVDRIKVRADRRPIHVLARAVRRDHEGDRVRVGLPGEQRGIVRRGARRMVRGDQPPAGVTAERDEVADVMVSALVARYVELDLVGRADERIQVILDLRIWRNRSARAGHLLRRQNAGEVCVGGGAGIFPARRDIGVR